MSKKILLGVTNYDEIAFTEFDTYPDGRFSCMFETVRPFNTDEIDMYELADEWCSGFDKETLYDLCEKHDCSPNDLSDVLAEECLVDDFIDCSLYSNEIQVNGCTWMFESESYGQHDLRKDGMKEYVNKEFFDFVNDLWDEYHLEVILADVFEKLDSMADEIMNTIDGEAWIKKYIEDNLL